MNWLTSALGKGHVLGDGAMGTMLIQRGLTLGESPELWNLNRPDAVQAIHRQYVQAGSDFVTCNTFGGQPLALARYGLDDQVSDINEAAVRLARQAAEGRAKVVASLGPFGGFLEPYGDTAASELKDSVTRQVDALLAAGVDGFVVETMSDPLEAGIAIRAARSAARELPLMATFAFQMAEGRFHTMMGSSVEEVVVAAVDAGADAVGANCGTRLGLADYLRLGKELVRAAGGVPVMVQPNAGSPVETNAGYVYAESPRALAAWALEAIQLGVSIVGGCCGTTPAHIQSMAEALDG